MSLDRAAFETHVARFFRSVAPPQRDRWREEWSALKADVRRFAGARLLLEENRSFLHGLAWWELGPARGLSSETDVLDAFLSTSTQLGAIALPHCPDAFAGVWHSADGARLTLGSDGAYGLSVPAETGTWRSHRSLMDELWIYRTGTPRRALQALHDGEVLVLRNLSGSPEQRWRRAP